MSDNLDITQLVSNQNNKETTINDKDGELDAAITENLTKTVTSTNAATVTQAELQRAVFLQVDPDGVDPPNAAITVTVDTAFKRGLFAVFNNTAEEVTVTITGQSAAAPSIPAGVVRVVLLQGSDVLDAPGLSFAAGSAGSPGMFFAADPDTGFYLKSDGVIGVASGGAEAFSFGVQGGLAQDGTVLLPAYSFASDPNTGFYSISADVLGVSVGGIEVARFGAQGNLLSDGTALLPSYSFASDPNSGLYSPTADNISISTGGSDRVRVDENGDVGVGVSSPGARLDILGTSDDAINLKVNGSIELNNSTFATRAYGYFSINDGNAMVGGNMRLDDTVTTGSHIGYSKGTEARGGSAVFMNNTPGSDYGELRFLQNNDTNDDTWDVRTTFSISGTPQLLSHAGGTVSAPDYSFNGDPDTGMYSTGADELAFASGGIQKLRLGERIYSFLNGDNLLPAYSFDTDPDTGMYRVGADIVGVSAGGTEAARFTSQGLLAPQGSNLAPSISFAADTDTGIYLESGNIMAFASNNIERFRMHGFSLRVASPGTETIPAIAFTDDDDTGIYRPAIDTPAITSGGSERQRWGTSRSTMAQPLQYDSYTVATVPVGAAGDNIFVSDETGGAVPAYSDGTNWRRYSDGAIIS